MGQLQDVTVVGDGMIAVNDVYACIQGEGCLTGVPMVMVRLQGCGVGCPWCDTKETWNRDGRALVQTLDEAIARPQSWTLARPADVAAFVLCRFPGPKWALISGGEPAEQDIRELVACLRRREYRVALETSGTATGHLGADLSWVCVSPKASMPGGKSLSADAMASADEIKMVIGREADLDALENILTLYRTKPGVQISLQPLSLSRKATQLCMKTAIARGWRLSVQMHKLVGAR